MIDLTEDDSLALARQRHWEHLGELASKALGRTVDVTPAKADVLEAACLEACDWLRAGAAGKALDCLEQALKTVRRI